MKMTSREQSMLAFLMVIALLAGGYYFLFQPQMKQLTALQDDQIAVRTQYESIKSDISRATTIKSSYTELGSKVEQRTLRYFPSIIQEKIVLVLNDLCTQSGVAAAGITYTFAAPVQTPVAQKSASGTSTSGTSSLVALLAKYQQLETGNKPAQPTPKAAMTEKELVVYQASLASMNTLNVSIQFTTAYANLKKFIEQLEAMKKTIYISNLNVTQMDNVLLTGNLELTLYAIPKLIGQDETYESWTIKNQYGKENPFQIIG